MGVVQLVLDAILHDILDDRSPPGHLVCLLRDSLLPLGRPDLPLVSVHDDVAAELGQVGDHVLVLWRDLGVSDQFGEVLLGNACTRGRKRVL